MKRHAPRPAVLGSLIMCACAAPSAAVGEFDDSSSTTDAPLGDDDTASNGDSGTDTGGDPQQCEAPSGAPHGFGVRFKGSPAPQPDGRETLACTFAGDGIEMDCLDQDAAPAPLELQFAPTGLTLGAPITVDLTFRSADGVANIAVAVRDADGALRLAGSIGEDFTVDPPWAPELTITPRETTCPTVLDDSNQEIIRGAIAIEAADLPPGTVATVFDGQRFGFTVDGSPDYDVHVAEARRQLETPGVSHWYELAIAVTPP